jgi:hypothetical protein
MKQTSLKRDEEQVLAIVNHLNETMTDPFVIPTIPPEPFESFMMVCSVPISLQIPLKMPNVCLIENSPFSKADFISAGSSSIIKDSKGSGGIVGITNQKSALVRWTLTRYFLASFSGAMNDRAGITSTSNTSHEEMKQTALKRDEEQVKAHIPVFECR